MLMSDKHVVPCDKNDPEFREHFTSADKPFKCDICFKGMSCEKVLRRHKKLQHFDKKVYQCDLCSKRFASQDSLNVHGRSHTGEKPFECDICHKAYTVKGSLYRHYDRHMSDKDKTFLCKVCNKAFSRKSLLTIHSETHASEEDKKFLCDVCYKTFPSKSLLSKHYYSHKLKRQKKYTCDICQKQFRQRSELDNHYRSHTGERPFVCPICNLTFGQKTCLNAHYPIHFNDRPFPCDKCEMSFKRKNSLLKHIRIHSDNRAYVCLICGKSFKYKDSLNIHSRTHTGVKPYVCNICQTDFAYKRRLDRHMLSQHGDKPYVCIICQTGFNSEGLLQKHQRKHKKELVSNSDIDKTTLSHTDGDIPFVKDQLRSDDNQFNLEATTSSSTKDLPIANDQSMDDSIYKSRIINENFENYEHSIKISSSHVKESSISPQINLNVNNFSYAGDQFLQNTCETNLTPEVNHDIPSNINNYCLLSETNSVAEKLQKDTVMHDVLESTLISKVAVENHESDVKIPNNDTNQSNSRTLNSSTKVLPTNLTSEVYRDVSQIDKSCILSEINSVANEMQRDTVMHDVCESKLISKVAAENHEDVKIRNNDDSQSKSSFLESGTEVLPITKDQVMHDVSESGFVYEIDHNIKNVYADSVQSSFSNTFTEVLSTETDVIIPDVYKTGFVLDNVENYALNVGASINDIHDVCNARFLSDIVEVSNGVANEFRFTDLNNEVLPIARGKILNDDYKTKCISEIYLENNKHNMESTNSDTNQSTSSTETETSQFPNNQANVKKSTDISEASPHACHTGILKDCDLKKHACNASGDASFTPASNLIKHNYTHDVESLHSDNYQTNYASEIDLKKQAIMQIEENYVPSLTYEGRKETFKLNKIETGHTSKFPCNNCQIVFSSDIDLKIHKCNLDTKSEYACGICEIEFSDAAELVCHKLSHEYICNVCQTLFQTEGDLETHKMTHKNLYICDTCQLEFSSSEDLKNHQIIHRPYICHICQTGFICNADLKNHQIVHRELS